MDIQQPDPKADVSRAGSNKSGMLVIFRATMMHIFGLDENQVDMLLKYMRTTLQITTMDMTTNFTEINRNALFMLKTALKKEIAAEEDANANRVASPDMVTESKPNVAPITTTKGEKLTLLQYFQRTNVRK